MTTADDLNEYVKLFNQLDKDHGGFISKEELKNGLKMAPKSITTPDDEEWDQILDGIDIDGDGQIDFTEFIAAAYDKTKLLNEANIKIAFDMLDSDGNG